MEKPVAKKAKFPIASIILTVFAMFGVFCSLGLDIVPGFLSDYALPSGITYYARLGFSALLSSLRLIGMLVFLVGLFLYRKKGNILCGAGVALNVVNLILSIFSNITSLVTNPINPASPLFFIFTELLIAAFLIVAAVFYFTEIKALGMPLKFILGLVAIILAFVSAGGASFITTRVFTEMIGYTADIEGFFYTFMHVPHITFSVLSSVVYAFTSLWFYLAIVLFTPKKG
ncbi:MAG: hypothetical protein II350_04640 [Clostridia bacterium]|nr:hypothetical protein [Clostridia bacterium]